jgi:hypothetical protein
MGLNRFSFTSSVPLAHLVRCSAAVRERFQSVLHRLDYSQAEQAKLELHRNTVRRRLLATFFANRILLIGSTQRDTAIPQSSDLDLLLILQVKEVRWGGELVRSSTVLDNVRKTLQIRYRTTSVGRDGQAVAVDFGDGERPIEVVPGVFLGLQDGAPRYLIPDGSGSWIHTSPESHNRFIALADARSGGKLKSVAKLAKYWRWCRTPEVPLSSFHIELLLAQHGICVGAKSHGQCLYELLKVLTERQCRGLQDPCGISGLIPAAGTEAKRGKVNATVTDSMEHAARALTAERIGRADDAIFQWNCVFNGNFPG